MVLTLSRKSLIDRIPKLVIRWLHLYSVTITQWFCRIQSSHLSYAVRSCFFARTDNHSPTRYYPPGTTGCCTNLLSSRFPWELTVLPWRLQGFSPWFETQPQPNCLFESHSDPQVSYQHRALYKLFKIYWWITCGKKFNKYSKIYIFQHSFPEIPFLTEKDG